MAPIKGHGAGEASIQLSTVDSAGVWTGQAGASPADNTTSSALKLIGDAGAALAARARAVAEFREGDSIIGQISFGKSTLQPFDVSLDGVDPTAITLTQGGSVDQTTNSLWTIFSTNPTNAVLNDVGMIIAQQFQSRNSAFPGTWYLNIIFPIGQASFRAGEATYQATSTWIMNFTPLTGGKFPNGVAFGANQGLANNETDHLFIVTKYPLAYTYYQGNAIATTFITGYRPFYSVVTLGANNNWFARNGTAVALTSIVPATGVATMSSAGVAADKNGLLYETKFVAI